MPHGKTKTEELDGMANMTPQELPELLPCPCGRNARISATDSAGRRSASCDDEDCYWSIVAFTDEQLVERWNRRAALAGAGAVAEVVELCGIRCPSWMGDGDPPKIPVGTKLFTHPAPVAVGVDEAMVERGVAAAAAVSDARLARHKVVREILTAALEAKPHA